MEYPLTEYNNSDDTTSAHSADSTQPTDTDPSSLDSIS